jgi:GH43 family beta-xylosidase
MNACDWKKYPEPVFSAKNGVYAPGHNANLLAGWEGDLERLPCGESI